MVTTTEPYDLDIVIRRGTDNRWVHRRVLKSTGLPIIPTAAECQVRSRPGGTLWAEADVTIDPVTGHITISIPEEATAETDWDRYKLGVYDLEVVVGGERLRWLQGRAAVSQDVTR